MVKIAKTYRDGRRYITEGICLRRLNYSNTSQVSTFITPDTGRVDCMFKGAWRSPKKGISAGLDLTDRYRLIYKQSPSGGLDTLLDRSMLEHFSGIRRSVDRAICSYYAMELMLNVTAPMQDCRELYGDLIRALRRFNTGEGLGIGVLKLEISALKHHGSCPDFKSCVRCKKNLDVYSHLVFSTSSGGIICERCNPHHETFKPEQELPVKAPELKLLRHLCRGDNSDSERASPKYVVRASKVLRHHMSWLLGKRLKMWKYLHHRHYSRFLARVRS